MVLKKVGSKRVIKLIVQVSPTSVDMLRFIHSNIREINHLGYHIAIEKIKANDHGAASVLRERGITKLPAVIDADGTVIIGRESIERFFLNGIEHRSDVARFSPGAGAPDDIHAYMTKGLWDGVERDNDGRLKMNTKRDRDEDLGDETVDDYDRRIADFERRSKNRHRHDEDIDDDMNRVNRRRNNAQASRDRRRRPRDDDDDEDPPRRGDDPYSTDTSAGSNQLEEEMYKAWAMGSE